MKTLQDLLEESKIKGYFSIGQIQNFTESCFDEQDTSGGFEEGEALNTPARQDAYMLAKEVLARPSNGTPDHYHNYAVTFARASEYDLACEVLLCGMRRYCTNTDLLADYLEYAIKSSNDEHYGRCEEIFARLQLRRPQFWNWRAYDFSIDYLLDKLDRGIGDPRKIQVQCLDLAKEFQRRIPNHELGFVAEANVHALFGETAKQVQTLKRALARTGLHAVQAAITLAEIYIKRNEPQEALKCVDRVLADLPDINTRSTPARVYSLRVICKVSLLLSDIQPGAGSTQAIDQVLAQEILNDWDNVKKLGAYDGQFYDTAKLLVKLVKVIGGVQLDEEF